MADQLASTLSRMPSEFITNRQGKDHALYDGLLDMAHREAGLKSIVTQALQLPAEANKWTAVCFATVTVDRGIFTGIGDANSENTGRQIAPHIIRMAETRAKARALRDALNIKGASLEELGPEDEDAAPQARRAPRRVQQTPPAAPPAHVNPETGEVRAPELAALYEKIYVIRDYFARNLGATIALDEHMDRETAGAALATLKADYNARRAAKGKAV